MIRLIVSDIDGTLIDSTEGSVSPRIFEQIERLSGEGIVFTPASGRQYRSLRRLFERVAGVEKEHEIVFRFLHESMKDGTLYKRDKPTLWICSECGYRAATKEAWKVCPLCKAKQGLVEIPLPFDH